MNNQTDRWVITVHRRNPTVYDELRVDDEASLINSHYDASLPTFVFAHGFTQNGQDGMCTAIRDGQFLFKIEPSSSER